MGKSKVTVLLNNSVGLFLPGDNVDGKVKIDVAEELKVTAITISANGMVFVQWTVDSGNYKVTYTHKKTYFNMQKVVKRPDPGQIHAVLEPGSYEYPFRIALPLDIPSSHEGRVGRVRYTIKAHVDIRSALTCYAKKVFNVANLLDLNKEPGIMNPVAAEEDKQFCCLCCASEPLTATLKIHDRSGFVPGETIVFSSQIQNKSNRTLKALKGRLVMVVTYHVGNESYVARHVLSKVKRIIQPEGCDSWDEGSLHIPAVPPSYLRGCDNIDIHYFVELIVQPTGPALDLKVSAEVVIGGLPLKQVAEKYGVSLPAILQLIQMLDPLNRPSAGLHDDVNMTPTLRHAGFAESAFGRRSVDEETDRGVNTGDSYFTPIYTYYTWERGDEVSNFTVQE